MHPDPRFRWDDEAALRAFVAARGFAHVFAMTAEGPMVAHAPVVVTEAGALRFHLARSNRICRYLDGLPAIASVAGADAYVSPDWYGSEDQVPTWNYVAVEAEGVARMCDRPVLIDQLDHLSAVHEAALAPKPAWTRDKLSPARFEAMLGALACFEIAVLRWRGTRKFSQNKSAAERDGVARALDAADRADMAALVRAA